jgi:hypothetical protein
MLPAQPPFEDIGAFTALQSRSHALVVHFMMSTIHRNTAIDLLLTTLMIWGR